MARANADLYGSTLQVLYFPRVAGVGGVTLDVAAECFCKSFDCDVVAAAVPAALADEAASVVVVVVTVVVEVGVVVMVTLVVEVGVGDALGEVLVVRFFFGRLTLFLRGAPRLRFFKNPVMRPFCLADDRCIALRGTAGGFAVSNLLGAFFFVIVEVFCCLCRASRGFPAAADGGGTGRAILWSRSRHTLGQVAPYFAGHTSWKFWEMMFLDRSREAVSLDKTFFPKFHVESEKNEILSGY